MGLRTAKIILIGDGAVGKTSLVKRYVEKTFDDRYITTIGANVKKKKIDDLQITLMIWDMYGQKLRSQLQSSHYSGANGAILVYDLTRMKTFKDLDDWLNELFDTTGEIPFVVLGNKFDLLEDYWEEMEIEDLDNNKFQNFVEENHKEVIEYYQNVYDSIPEFNAVPFTKLSEWAEEKKEKLETDFSYYMSSAKTGENVEKAFREIAKLILNGDNDE